MNLIVPAAPARPRCPHCLGQEQRFVLHDIGWQDFQTLGAILRDRPGVRLTYFRGTLELMTTSRLHEVYKTWLGRLIETLAEEFDLPLVHGGNSTFQREDVEGGFEGDESYWLQHAEQQRNRTTWDPNVDPPPDLLSEIEVSRGAQDRMAIFAQFGVPEVWCFDGQALRVYLLQPDRSYRQVEESPTFPGIPLQGLLPFLQPQQGQFLRDNIRAFRTWVREQLARKA